MSMNTDPDVVADGLRAWARGIYPLEAAVELLIRSCGGRFASSGMPWVQPGEEPGLCRSATPHGYRKGETVSLSETHQNAELSRATAPA
ncbi:MAG: hypothetical protein KDB60_12785 [Propionibacteriaceae bacterium]|jgi:hypothetical protein|nr:hypothetical protein [Propionibacteriaceae bacterium]